VANINRCWHSKSTYGERLNEMIRGSQSPAEPDFDDAPPAVGDIRDAAVLQRQREYRQAAATMRQAGTEQGAGERRLAEERAGTDSHRRLPLIPVWIGIALAAAMEVFAAEPAAEALGLSRVLTYVVTAILVAAVVGGAVMLTHAAPERRPFLIGFQAVVLAVLFGLRFLYLTAFEGTLPAFLSAAGLTLLTLVIYLLVEELARRAEPVDLWHARRVAGRAARRRRQAERAAARAEAELQKAIDARDISRSV
jgi:hypothetical protein